MAAPLTCNRKFLWWSWQSHCFHELRLSGREINDPDHAGLCQIRVMDYQCCRCKVVQTRHHMGQGVYSVIETKGPMNGPR
jgi:hypothetical protein